jgi:broad specificity phosphatase PhoE
MRRLLVTVGCLALVLGAAPARAAEIASAETSAPSAERTLSGARLVQALRGGGYVIYFRHTATDFSRNDRAMSGFDDCANQRPLNEQGRRDAAGIGERVRGLGLPVGQVMASPMCRTMEHAQLTFFRALATPGMRERDGDDYPALKELLAAPVAAGDNRWLFGHGTPFRTVAGPPQLAEGEAVVIAPGGRSWTVVARITVDEWAKLPAAP